jgi:Cys-tRNA(Pro)/Cys-tRNA(Cys) deacylase
VWSRWRADLAVSAEQAGIGSKTVGGHSTRATQRLSMLGIPFRLHSYAHDSSTRDRSAQGRSSHDRKASYGAEAAAALGVPGQQVFKTLIASVDGQLTAAVVPVTARLNLKALADAVGGRKAEMADTALAERATGYVVGGISPVAQRRNLPVVLDASALGHKTVFCSAGQRGLQIELAPADLVLATAATVAPIARALLPAA